MQTTKNQTLKATKKENKWIVKKGNSHKYIITKNQGYNLYISASNSTKFDSFEKAAASLIAHAVRMYGNISLSLDYINVFCDEQNIYINKIKERH